MLTFTHPLAQLAAINGLYKPHLLPLLYKYAGTHVIHHKSEYSDPNRYNEIINKVNDFVYYTNLVLSITSPFNPSNELDSQVISCLLFEKETVDYSFVEPVELRERLVELLSDKRRLILKQL